MQLARIGLLVALTTVALTTATRISDAVADGEITIRGVYYKERATRVEQPMVDARFDVGEHGTLDAHVLIDAITSASVGSSDGAPFTEKRVEGGVGYRHVFGHHTIGATLRHSNEPDYQSSFTTLHADSELFKRNLTLGVVAGAGVDSVTNAGAPALVPRIKGKLTSYLLSASVAQLVDANTVAALTFDLTVLDGYQQNPYRMVPAGSTLVGERHPDQRTRLAAALSVRHFVDRTATTVIAAYRIYRDDWGITAHTPEVRIIQDAGDTMQIAASYRYHHQGPADFWQRSYPSSDPVVAPFLSADEKLSRFDVHTVATTFTVTGATFGWSDRWSEVRGEFILEYNLQNNRFGNAGVAHAALTIPLRY
jgi:Protein of unknown function (DUF3570)